MQLDRTFSALSDPTRRAILARLAEGEATVTDLMQLSQISQPAISRHLKVLEQAGLIAARVARQSRPRVLKAEALTPARDWLEATRAAFEQNYARLDTLLAELQGGAETGEAE
ncbi:ArsR family transcriptional regulator [Rhodophyticola sp. CCM32]|uniref:ArsR/SmtB family transcription factor n=1 Tax=Rhodophyticola sp. CCM32 TaxID=2916397 RepID=UPI00107F1AF4|nr:metalloregulator ArsR/SmtB family transcription factor [Rhodophyticola sp. CCM32]QBY00705.1 ArsR family transcriptional regulator [Rhodophyticola sp. CCM32]